MIEEMPTRTLQAPPAHIDQFSEHHLRKGMVIYRAHATNRQPLWFESGDHSRFALYRPNGTCYFARDMTTAIEGMLIGFSGRDRNVTERHANAFSVTRFVIARPYRLANIQAAKSRSLGARPELTQSVSMHRLTKQWAQSLSAAGFHGISYTHRFSPPGTVKPNAIALFGRAGTHKHILLDGEATLSGRDAAEAAGFTVLPTPSRTQLSLI